MIQKYHFKSLLSVSLSAVIAFSNSQCTYAAETIFFKNTQPSIDAELIVSDTETKDDKIGASAPDGTATTAAKALSGTETTLPSPEETTEAPTKPADEALAETESSEELEVSSETETSEETVILQETEGSEETETLEESIYFEGDELLEETEYSGESDLTGYTESLLFAGSEDDSSFYPEYTSGTVQDGYYILKISSKSMEQSNASSVLQNALNYALGNATDSLPYKILIEPGIYTLTKSLLIYSNTCLYMEGVTFFQAESCTGNMLRVGKSTDSQSGYCYKNITIDGGVSGGVWDEDYNNHTVIKVAHTQNFSAKNITVQNTIDGHLMEVAGVNGFSLTNCTFQNQLLDTTRYTEAIQFDILVSGHLSGYTPEDLANSNISITGCTFFNVPKGIGSHTLILNNPMSNVQIMGNTFQSNACAAIDLVSATNCTVSGNTITNCPKGILFSAITKNGEGAFLSSTPAREGGIPSSTPVAYMTPLENQNITITDNRINCSGKDRYDSSLDNTGIFIGGYIFPSGQSPADGDSVPAGDYYISDVSIAGNTISTAKDGIILRNVKNARVDDGNQITFTAIDNSCYGIHATSLSENCILQGNSIIGCLGTSISVSGSASGISVIGNTITNTSYCGIYAYDATLSTVSENQIISSQGYGILVNHALVTNIYKNIISSPAYDGINVYNTAYVKSINENTITSSGSSGIHISEIGRKLTVSSNILKRCGTAQIFINTNSNTNTVTMTENRITGTQKVYGILINSGKVSVYDNKIVSCRVPVQVAEAATGTIKKNTYKNNKKDAMRITGTAGSVFYKNLSKPTSLKTVRKDKTSIQLTWKKVSGADGYIIYRSDSANGSFKKVAKVTKGTKTTYTNKRLMKNQKYYYQVMAYRKSGNTNITVYSPASKTVSKKL